MKSVRSSPTAFRFDPTVKKALAVIADKDGRSMANMIEWLIKQHCEREGLGWPPAGAAPAAHTQSKTAKVAAKAPKAKKR
ncbi:MAG: hypothetical protein EKK45_18520 [Curvibacter sp.]|nr:MAG: hypothetical protein EKK45_18520 [Curvibacter sp.]